MSTKELYMATEKDMAFICHMLQTGKPVWVRDINSVNQIISLTYTYAEPPFTLLEKTEDGKPVIAGHDVKDKQRKYFRIRDTCSLFPQGLPGVVEIKYHDNDTWHPASMGAIRLLVSQEDKDEYYGKHK